MKGMVGALFSLCLIARVFFGGKGGGGRGLGGYAWLFSGFLVLRVPLPSKLAPERDHHHLHSTLRLP